MPFVAVEGNAQRCSTPLGPRRRSWASVSPDGLGASAGVRPGGSWPVSSRYSGFVSTSHHLHPWSRCSTGIEERPTVPHPGLVRLGARRARRRARTPRAARPAPARGTPARAAGPRPCRKPGTSSPPPGAARSPGSRGGAPTCPPAWSASPGPRRIAAAGPGPPPPGAGQHRVGETRRARRRARTMALRPGERPSNVARFSGGSVASHRAWPGVRPSGAGGPWSPSRSPAVSVSVSVSAGASGWKRGPRGNSRPRPPGSPIWYQLVPDSRRPPPGAWPRPSRGARARPSGRCVAPAAAASASSSAGATAATASVMASTRSSTRTRASDSSPAIGITAGPGSGSLSLSLSLNEGSGEGLNWNSSHPFYDNDSLLCSIGATAPVARVQQPL